MNEIEKDSSTEFIQQLHHDLSLLNSELKEHGRTVYLADYFKKLERPVVDSIVSNKAVYDAPITERLRSELIKAITLLKEADQNSNEGKIRIYCERIMQFALLDASDADFEHELNDIKAKRKEPKSNEFRKGLEKLAQENELDRKEFISDAKKFLNENIKAGKPRSDYISAKGWPKVTLHTNPFLNSDIPESTRKDWLHKAIKAGEI